MLAFALATVVVALLVFYASWTARRLDRLHARLDAAAAALDAHLRDRAAAAAGLTAAPELRAPAVAALAQAALVAAEARGLGHDREMVENALSRALRDTVAAGGCEERALQHVGDAVMRASFARQFHNDAVRDALVVRRRRIVRFLHLAGSAPLPAYFEIDDGPVAIVTGGQAHAPYD